MSPETPVTFLVHVFAAFFAIMNPVANSSIFISLTKEMDSGKRRMVAIKSCLITFIIISVFIVGGETILKMFGITVDAFRIAGGIIIFFIGYNMLQGRNSPIHTLNDKQMDEEKNAEQIAFSPLAMPILAGPGAIAVAIGFAADANAVRVIGIMTVFGLMCVITALSFMLSDRLVKLVGENGISILTRSTGLILAVIAVQMGFDGVHGLMNP